MSWGCVALAAALGLAAAFWLRTRRYRDDEDVVYRTLSPWWLPAAATLTALLATPFWVGVAAPVALTYVLALVWALTLTFIDLEVHRLPDVLTLRAYPVAAVLLAGCALLGDSWSALLRATTSAGIAVVVFLVLVGLSLLLSPDGSGFGFGDVKLAGVLAGLLGWFSWTNAVYGLLVGCIIGGLVAAVLLVAGRAGRKSVMSYGPSLVAGAYLAAMLLPA